MSKVDPATFGEKGGKIQIDDTDIEELVELLGAYKTMLTSHEKRLAIIEQVLIDALQAPPPNRKQRRAK